MTSLQAPADATAGRPEAGYDRGPDVAGAVANLLRATPHTDSGDDKLQEAYGAALEAARLVPVGTGGR